MAKTLYQQRQLGNVRGNPLRDYFSTQNRASGNPYLPAKSIDEKIELVLVFSVEIQLPPIKVSKRWYESLDRGQRMMLNRYLLDRAEGKLEELHTLRELARTVDEIATNAGIIRVRREYEESGESR